MTRVVGVDIGGTKTHLALAPTEDDGRASAELREVVVPTSSWRDDSTDAVASAAALRDVLVHRFGPDAAAAPIAVGAHGCDSTAQCRELAGALQARVSGRVVVVNDAELMPLAMGVDGAIGVAVGTGSIAAARGEAGELIIAGGRGWLLGGEGSPAGVVREGPRAVLADLDHGRAPDPLGRRLMAAFAAHDGAELALAVSRAASAEVWGRHATGVFAAADDGSTLAVRVIREAGEQLAVLVGRLRQRGIRAGTVVAGGTVIERQPRLRDAFSAALARDHPSIALHVLDRPPVMGAIALARRTSQPLIADVTS